MHWSTKFKLAQRNLLTSGFFFFFSSLLGCYGWVNRCFNFLKHYNHPVAFNSSLPLFFLFFFFRKCAFVIINICLEKSQWWHERWHSRGAFVTTVTKHFEGCALITAQQFRTIFISVLICLKRSFWNKQFNNISKQEICHKCWLHQLLYCSGCTEAICKWLTVCPICFFSEILH